MRKCYDILADYHQICMKADPAWVTAVPITEEDCRRRIVTAPGEIIVMPERNMVVPVTEIPTFLCADGTASFATTRRGACASHGGIVRPPQLPRTALPPPPEDRPVTLRCSDGTASSSGTRRGACSSHGGLRE